MQHVPGKTYRHKLAAGLASLAGLVYDNSCPSCARQSDSIMTFPICTSCFNSATGYNGPGCKICAKPFASPYSEICGDCLSNPPAFETTLSYGLYEGVLLEAIHLFKFNATRRLAGPLARILSTLETSAGADVIIPVPTTKRGLRARGYNQSALLARKLGRIKGIRDRLDLLDKIKETPPQVGLSRRARLKNLRGAFRASPEAEGLRVILVDDVITTGATMRECAKALKRAGAMEITAMSVARTY